VNGLAQAAVPAVSGPALDNKRVAAALIDLLVLFFVGFLIGVLAGAWTPGSRLLVTAWALYYYFALELLTGQTVGKKLMGLRVAQVDGSPPEMRQVAIRTVLRVIDGVALYLVGLIVMLATGERRQRLGDVAAKTIATTALEEKREEASAPVAPLHPEPEPEPAPAAVEEEPPFEPYQVPEPEEPHIELVPDPPADEPEEKPRIEIVSPIDLVMGDAQKDEDDPPPQPA
jgi:uncharacterized RDD family membrane protein YckC